MMLRAWSRLAARLLVLVAPLLLATHSAAWAGAPPTLMVLYFDNNTGDPQYDHLSKGLADMMISDLATVTSLRVVERAKLQALLDELELQRSKYFDQKTTQRLGKGAGAAYAVTGAIVSLQPTIRLDVRVIRVRSGAVVKSASVTGSQQDFFELEEKLTAELLAGLPRVLSESDAEKARAAAQANRVTLTALVDYGKGLDARDRGDLPAATEYLQQVVSANPDFALGKTRHAQVLRELEEARSAREAALSEGERLLLAHIQQHLSDPLETRIPYRVLLGQYQLRKIKANLFDVETSSRKHTHVAVVAPRPAASYHEHIRAYVINQQWIYSETKDLASYASLRQISREDAKLAEEIGISFPGSVAGASPSDVLRSLSSFLMRGYTRNESPPSSWGVCFYQLDPSYPDVALESIEYAVAHLERHHASTRETEIMRALREWAETLLILRRPEEAIAKLQYGLKQYPKSTEFRDTELTLRQILDGKRNRWTSCRAPR